MFFQENPFQINKYFKFAYANNKFSINIKCCLHFHLYREQKKKKKIQDFFICASMPINEKSIERLKYNHQVLYEK